MKDLRLTPLNIGPVPDNWNGVFLGDLADRITNGFVGQSLPHQVNSQADGVLYVQGTNIRPNRFDWNNVTYVTKEFHEAQKKSCLRPGDLLTVQSGHIGTTAVVDNRLPTANCHALIITRLRKGAVEPSYLSFYMNSEVGQARMRGLHVGSTILHINTSELAKYKVPIPPPGEQRALVGIFNNFDNREDILLKQIELGRLRRKALMQQLLTGKRRFPGFTKPWKKVSFLELASKVQRKNSAGIARVLTASGEHGLIDQAEYFKKSMAGEDQTGYIHLKKGEFAYNRSSMNGYPCGAVKRLDAYEEGIVSTLYLCFALKPHLCSDFYAHLFEYGYLNHQLMRITPVGGRAHGLLNVTAGDFYKMLVPVPEIEEQRRIAEVLNLCDQEIRLLKDILAAYQRQKRGLMQQLLTGKRRVKVPAATEAS